MVWNRELGAFLIAILLLISFVFLLIKRKNLQTRGSYFIAAFGILTFIENFCTAARFFNEKFNSSLLYVIGIDLVVFFLFFLYFQNILTTKKLKRINLVLIALFLLNFIGSACILEDFFTRFPFSTYLIEVVLLTVSIGLVLSQTFNSDKILALEHYFPFWVCISLLVTYLGVLPLLVLSYTAAKSMNLNIFFAILFLVNVVGYSILLIGILKAKSEN